MNKQPGSIRTCTALAVGKCLLLSLAISSWPTKALAKPQSAGQTSRSPSLSNPESEGPIPVRDSRPFNMLFLQFTPESGDVLKKNANRYDLQLDVINNDQIPAPGNGSTLIEDNEYQRLKFSWRHGLPHDTEFAMFVPLEWRNGGMLDGVISAYHHLFGLADNSLDLPAGASHIPLYQSHLEVVDPSGKTLVNAGNACGLGDTTATLKHSLIKQTRRSSLALRLGAKLPTGSATELLGSGHFDIGASVDGRYSMGRDISLYGNLGYVMLGHTSIAYGSRPNNLQTLTAIEYKANRRDSFVLQVDGNGEFVNTGNSFGNRSNVTATFGYRRKFDRVHTGFISFSEGGHIHNYTLPAFSNASPNFTVSMGMTWLP